MNEDANKIDDFANKLSIEREKMPKAKRKRKQRHTWNLPKTTYQRPFYANDDAKNWRSDGVVGGLIYSTADMLRVPL